MLTSHSIDLLFSRRTKRRFAAAIAASALAALADAAGVLVILPLMQLLTGGSRESGWLGLMSDLTGDPSDARLGVYLALLTFTAFLSKAVIAISVRWWVLGFVFRQEAETSVRLLRYYLMAPYGLHLRRNSADLIRTMNDANGQVHSLVIVAATMSAIAEGLTMLAVSVGLLVIMPIPTLAVGIYLVLAGLAFHRAVRRRAKAAGDRLLDSFVDIYQAALQALSGIKEIKVRRKTEHFLGTFGDARARHAEARRIATFIGELPKYVFEVLFIVGIGLATVIVFSMSPSDEALSALALFAAAGFRLLPSMVRSIAALSQIRIGESALKMVVAEIELARADEALVTDPEPVGTPRPVEAVDVEVRAVSFVHEGSAEAALDGVSMTIPSGSAVALVGASGSGKSTLVDVVLGLHTPATGTVFAGGRDIRTFLPAWQSSIGMVPQDVYLLDDSLRMNIAFGERSDEIDDDRVAEAIELAQLDQLVKTLSAGVDTFVGERGVRLSGGQRQRIGIARALYARPSLLVLDEATSALDNETEQRITQTIAGLHGQMTILMVAHRLSTVRHCDQIVYLKEGRVEDIGTFDDLRSGNPEFAELARLGSLQ